MDRLTRKKALEIAKAFCSEGYLFPEDLSLRVADMADVGGIVALGRQCFSYNPPTSKEMRYSIGKAHGACFVMSDGAGAMAAYAYFEAHARRQCLYLNTVAVAESSRGRGLGKILYHLGDRIAEGIEARAMYCHVREDNAVNIHLVEKHGFQRLRVELQYYDDGASAYVFKKLTDKPQGYAQMRLADYLAYDEARKVDFAYPEINPAVWATFFANGEAFPDLKMIEETPVHLFLGRYALYLDPFDAERDGLNWALSTSVVDIPLSVSFDEFLSDCPALCAAIEAARMDKPVVTDSFMFADGYPDVSALTENWLIGLNSPVAAIHENFAGYLESLTSERRKKFRRAEDEFSESGLRFELSNQTLSDAEFVFVVDNLKKKWGEDYLYALCQTLWSLAVSRHTPQNVYFMRVYDADRLVFLQTMIARGQTMVCQSIVKDEETHYNGIAAYTDFQCVKALSGGGFLYFDPSCRTGLNDPESIGIAKRATVNRNLVKPIFCAGKNVPDQVSCIVRDKVLQGKSA